jgi:hypothetical protein
MNYSAASTERSFDTSDFDSDEYERDREEIKVTTFNVKESLYFSTNLIY